MCQLLSILLIGDEELYTGTLEQLIFLQGMATEQDKI